MTHLAALLLGMLQSQLDFMPQLAYDILLGVTGITATFTVRSLQLLRAVR
jgi:hypothetical protein